MKYTKELHDFWKAHGQGNGWKFVTLNDMQESISAFLDEIDRMTAELADANNKLNSYPVTYIHDLEWEKAKLTALVERMKEDGERLASTYVIEVFPHEWVCRGGCHHWARFGEQIEHSPDCPITLHRALMKELEK